MGLVCPSITTTSVSQMTDLMTKAVARRSGSWAYILTVTEISEVNVSNPASIYETNKSKTCPYIGRSEDDTNTQIASISVRQRATPLAASIIVVTLVASMARIQ